MTRVATLALLAALASGALVGCGGSASADTSVDVEALAEGVRQDLELAADDGYDTPRSVECYHAPGSPAECVVYFHVADDVALTAWYRLRRKPPREEFSDIEAKYGPFYEGRLIDSHDQLDVPERLNDVTEV